MPFTTIGPPSCGTLIVWPSKVASEPAGTVVLDWPSWIMIESPERTAVIVWPSVVMTALGEPGLGVTSSGRGVYVVPPTTKRVVPPFVSRATVVLEPPGPIVAVWPGRTVFVPITTPLDLAVAMEGPRSNTGG